jgi:hypothetical protein
MSERLKHILAIIMLSAIITIVLGLTAAILTAFINALTAL